MVEHPCTRRIALSLLRQGRHYLLIGILQWLLDWGVMVALSHGGLPIEPANVAGRISGAMLGFWLNGRITFSGDQHRIGRRQFARFLAMWLLTTAISTWSLGANAAVFGLRWALNAKPALVVALGAVGFLLSRHWVYRH
jgi:putative flippase GtrA